MKESAVKDTHNDGYLLKGMRAGRITLYVIVKHSFSLRPDHPPHPYAGSISHTYFTFSSQATDHAQILIYADFCTGSMQACVSQA